jgi:chemotaxis protein CheD
MGVPAAKILPGEFYVSSRGEMIVTVLGSCIAACIRDTRIGVGGMNHFMLPFRTDLDTRAEISASSRYGNWAMEFLINEILKQGGTRRNLEVKLFGGGQVLANMTDIGKRNIEFALDYLAREGLRVVAQDVGGELPRKVLYFPDTGAVKLKKLRTVQNNTLETRERHYLRTLNAAPQSGEVELF